jgi:hypothetical protein
MTNSPSEPETESRMSISERWRSTSNVPKGVISVPQPSTVFARERSSVIEATPGSTSSKAEASVSVSPKFIGNRNQMSASSKAIGSGMPPTLPAMAVWRKPDALFWKNW